jgi:hypothetical protein
VSPASPSSRLYGAAQASCSDAGCWGHLTRDAATLCPRLVEQRLLEVAPHTHVNIARVDNRRYMYVCSYMGGVHDQFQIDEPRIES